MSLEIGFKAPDFKLPATTKEHLSLSSLLGKKVVLYFYPKDDTSGCTLEARDFQCLKEQFEACETVILGLSPDNLKSHHAFKDKNDIEFPLVSDENKEICQKYGVWVEKSMYGRKYMGVERSTFLINRDGTIQEIWRKVKVPDHAEIVLLASQKLG